MAKPPNKEYRVLKNLSQAQIFELESVAAFNDIVSLAAQICQIPIASIEWINPEEQWLHSKQGWKIKETSDQTAFSTYTIQQNDLFIVQDALVDKRFSSNCLVTSEPYIRFYAGIPLITSEGLVLGTLSLFDYVARNLILEQQEALRVLSRQIVTQYELQRDVAQLVRSNTERIYTESALQKTYHQLEIRHAELALTQKKLQTTLIQLQVRDEKLLQQNEALSFACEALQAENQRYRDLFDFAPDSYLVTNIKGIVEEANCAVGKLLAIRRDRLVGKPLIVFVHKDDRSSFQAQLASLQERQHWEVRFKSREGVSFPAAINVAPVRDRQGKMVGWRWLLRDITQLKRKEQERLELIEREHAARIEAETARKQITSILESITDAFFALDNEWRFTYVNHQVEQLTQKKREELIGKTIWDEFPELVNSSFYTHYKKAISEQISIVSEEFYPTLQMWFEVYAYPSENGLSVCCKNVTERKQSQETILQQAALLDITTDAIFVQSLDNEIFFWNKGAEILYQISADEVLGKKSNELFNQKSLSEVEDALNIVIEKGEWQGELHQFTNDGKEIIVQSRWTLVRDKQAQPQSILIVNTDITGKKQLEAQFLRAQRMESIGTLASGIAHDLNNVLAPIQMAVQLLEKPMPNERVQHLLAILKANTKRGADLVKQVLSFGRGIESKLEVLQFKHLISEIKQVAKQTFPKSIEINTDIPQNLWTISGDVTQLHQVLMNLCVNARDAMPQGGTLTISASNLKVDEQYAQMNLDAKPGFYIVINVSDTGMGIPPEILDRIFDPFFTTKEAGKGTGLGLSTVISIIKSHGGFIDVNSKLGKGTKFKVYLPVEKTVSQSQAELRIEAPEELPKGNGETILVVDDEPAIREITKKSLETYDYKVLTADNGINAIAVYVEHRQKISVVITDMMMPEMDGLATIRMLQKINPDVKVVGVSGLASSELVAESTNDTVKSFLYKPFTGQQLLKTLQEVINAE